jgi:hypothetical protein
MFGHDLLLKTLSGRFEYLHDERRNGQEEPFETNPPPTDEQPPEYTVMLIHQFRLDDRFSPNVFTSASGTYHVDTSLFDNFPRNIDERF